MGGTSMDSLLERLNPLHWPHYLYEGWQKRRTERFKRDLLHGLARCGEGIFFEDVRSVIFLGAPKISLGSNVAFNRYVYINAMGGVSIGDDSIFAPFCVIHSGDHVIDDLTRPIRLAGHKKDEICIGKDVWVGAHAVILRGSLIPDHCVIGAGALVDRRLKLAAYDIVRGNPAVVVANRLKYAQKGRSPYDLGTRANGKPTFAGP